MDDSGFREEYSACEALLLQLRTVGPWDVGGLHEWSHDVRSKIRDREGVGTDNTVDSKVQELHERLSAYDAKLAAIHSSLLEWSSWRIRVDFDIARLKHSAPEDSHMLQLAAFRSRINASRETQTRLREEIANLNEWRSRVDAAF